MYAVVDIETTGSHPAHDHIIEIAVYLHDGHKVTDQFCSLINPNLPIPPFIARLTGITDEMVAHAPELHEIAPKLHEMLDGRIFVAHNVHFDHSFVKQSLSRHGLEFEGEMLCTIKTGRTLVPGLPSYKLSSMCKSLAIDLDNAHRAYSDALATAHILSVLNEKAEGNLKPYLYKKEPRKNPSQISEEQLDALPSQAGILYFHNHTGEVIMLTSATNIRKKAWALVKRFHHKRLLPLATEATAVNHETTDSELLALVKQHLLEHQSTPKFNRKQRPFETRFGITDDLGSDGYLRLKLMPFKTDSIFHKVFASHQEARKTIKDLSQSLQLVDSAELFSEPVEQHNQKVEAAIHNLTKSVKRYLVFDKITQAGASTVFYVENEVVKGYCTLNKNEKINHLDDIAERMFELTDDPAIFRIVHRFATKGKCRKITHLNQP
ncbi:MAG: PolC-type DNA polymerase III [Bacteroidota bacterium]